MPHQAKGKANYKVDALILVVEELLPNGAQGWQEVATLYLLCSGVLILWDHDDMKQHWIEKQVQEANQQSRWSKRDVILRCQRIQQRIHAKTSFAIMGVELGGDDGLSVEEEEDKDKDEEEDEDEEGSKKMRSLLMVTIMG